MSAKRILGIGVGLVIGCFLVYGLNTPWETKSSPIPALGKLLNPYDGLWQNSEKPFEDISFNNAAIKEPIDIVYDQDLVPHIYAKNMNDALFAQGYVEAQNRLFQMDISTRDPDGRLSEILGEKLLERDLSQRRLGLGYAADNALESWKKFPDQFKLLEAYTAGVNHFISSLSPKDWPMEYKLLGAKPEAWTIRKSALLLKAMSQTLCGYEEDVANSNALALFKDDFPLVYPERNPNDIPVIPNLNGAATPTREIVSHMGTSQIPVLTDIYRKRSPDGVGSNNWAIMPSKSVSGNAILCNDPHLGLSLPSVWFELHISTPDFSARGVSLLGMPGIMIGFNEHIAWGETNVGHDVMDYHKIHWTNSQKTQYMYDSAIRDVSLRIERIKVKGKPDVIDTVKYTVWGPVANEDADLALRWIVHDPVKTPDFMTFVQGMTCKNYTEYLSATASFYAPAQNFIYADKNGNIGLRINGNLPIKSEEMGRFVRDGNRSDLAWKGFIPRSENPQSMNPEQGYLASANQWSADTSYPYYYNGNFEAFRGRRINQLLRSKDKFSVRDMVSFQNDVHHVLAQDALPVMLSLSSGADNFVLSALKKWDYKMTTNSQAALYFETWFHELHKTLWDEVYSQKDILLPEPDLWHTANVISAQKNHPFLDVEQTPSKENLEDLVQISLQQTLEKLRGQESQTYGSSRNVKIRHLLRIPALSIDSLELGGHKHTLNAQQETFGPSWRMIVELNDVPNAYGTYPGGQSGNPASAYYSNRVKTWASGSYDTLGLPKRIEEIDNTLFHVNALPQ